VTEEGCERKGSSVRFLRWLESIVVEAMQPSGPHSSYQVPEVLETVRNLPHCMDEVVSKQEVITVLARLSEVPHIEC
jgi:hypothetical protein